MSHCCIGWHVSSSYYSQSNKSDVIEKRLHQRVPSGPTETRFTLQCSVSTLQKVSNYVSGGAQVCLIYCCTYILPWSCLPSHWHHQTLNKAALALSASSFLWGAWSLVEFQLFKTPTHTNTFLWSHHIWQSFLVHPNLLQTLFVSKTTVLFGMRSCRTSVNTTKGHVHLS